MFSLIALVLFSITVVSESSAIPLLAQSTDQQPDPYRAPRADLAMLDRSIHVNHPAHAQITVINPGSSDNNLEGQIIFDVPDYISIFSATGGASGGSAIISIPINPIAPGIAYPVDISVSASNDSIGSIPEIEATVELWPVGIESEEERSSRTTTMVFVELLQIKPGTQSDCVGIDSKFCDEKDFYDARFTEPLCTNLRCEPWGDFLIAYAAIAGTLMGIVTIRSTLARS